MATCQHCGAFVSLPFKCNFTQVVAAVMKQNLQVRDENQQLWDLIKSAFSGQIEQKNHPYQRPTAGGNGGRHAKT